MNLESDLKRLKTLAYHRAEWGADLLRKIHRLPKKAKEHPDDPLLGKLRSWLLAPATLWPANLDAVGHHAVDTVRAGKRLDRETSLLLEILAESPGETTQAVVGQHEHEVQRGNYEHLIHAAHKFASKEQDLEHCDELMAEWRKVTALHRARGIQKQGPKLWMNQMQRREQAESARRLVEQAKAKGIKGSKRDYWVMGQLGLDARTDTSRLRRLLKML